MSRTSRSSSGISSRNRDGVRGSERPRWTRAQRKLYLTRACTRVVRGASRPRTPSRFLLEIPDELLEVRDIAEEARQKVPADEVRDFFASLASDE